VRYYMYELLKVRSSFVRDPVCAWWKSIAGLRFLSLKGNYASWCQAS
jgi:hypothetical protein